MRSGIALTIALPAAENPCLASKTHEALRWTMRCDRTQQPALNSLRWLTAASVCVRRQTASPPNISNRSTHYKGLPVCWRTVCCLSRNRKREGAVSRKVAAILFAQRLPGHRLQSCNADGFDLHIRSSTCSVGLPWPAKFALAGISGRKDHAVLSMSEPLPAPRSFYIWANVSRVQVPAAPDTS
ncbi:hypothetical protein F4780DRAFT_655239 [Xylariomycetidae sp. FL0641]|nr:hypothetical protein F4780DRAFT_655239 [Xylariomycetidae sp. FL0641]